LEPRAVAAQALHLANFWIVRHGYAGQPAGTGVYWSLAVEEHFYLLFPWLYLALVRAIPRRGTQAAVLWTLCAGVLAWRCVLVFVFHAPEDRTYVATDARLDSILFGCALALRGNPVLDGASRLSDATWKRRLLPASLALLLGTFAFREPAFRQSFRYSLQGIALYPIFVVAVRFPQWGPVRLLNRRELVALGVLSYSLYLVHHVVLDALRGSLAEHVLLRAAVAFGVSLAFAWLVHRVVERPCGSLRRRLLHGSTTVTSEVRA
jgi:peptidoglycan/LPS O-acetylase OafA/YrhL